MSKYKKSSNKHARLRLTASTPSALRLLVLAGAAVIVVSAFLAYYPSLNGGFIWDDKDLYLTGNVIIKSADGLFRFWCTTEPYEYYPISNSTLWIEWRLWEINSTGYHLTNLILHVAEALLIWIILRKLSIPGGFLAALIFALHPVNVESVAWIAQRKDMLAVLFFLLSILWYLYSLVGSAGSRTWADLLRKMERKSRNLAATSADFVPPVQETASPISPRSLAPSHSSSWYCLSFLAFALAMLSKGSVAIEPVLLLGIVWWLRPLTWRDLLRSLPFFGIAVILTIVNVWFQRHGHEDVIRNADFYQRLLGAGGVVWFYLYKSIMPLNLLFIYPQWHVDAGNLLWWLPLSAALLVTGILWMYRKSWSRPFLFAWGFFCAALFPVLGFTDAYFMKYSLVADHYQHVAIIGVISLAAASLGTWRSRSQGVMRRAGTSIAVVATGILLFLTWRQSGLYVDETTLYLDTLSKNPGCWMAYNNLGMLMMDSGKLQEAKSLIEHSLAINPDNAHAQNNMADILLETGHPEEAIKHCQIAMKIDPEYPGTYSNLAMAMLDAGRVPEAIEYFEQALKLKPNNAVIHNNLANAFLKAGRTENAIDQYNLAMKLKPDFVEACCNLAAAYAKAGRSREAIATGQKALDLARHKGQTALYKQMEHWLKSYRSSLSNLPNKPPTFQSDAP